MAGQADRPPGAVPVDGEVDPDLPSPAETRSGTPPLAAVVGAVAIGGLAGAEARYGLALGLPHAEGTWPWSTLLINVSGCVAIGVLMVIVLELVDAHPLVRPLLGVGVLGGYTTFSTFSVDVLALGTAGRVGPAIGYAVATPVLALAGVTLGARVTRFVAYRLASRGRQGDQPGDRAGDEPGGRR